MWQVNFEDGIDLLKQKFSYFTFFIQFNKII